MSHDPFRQPPVERLAPTSDPPPSAPVSSSRPEHALVDATAQDSAVLTTNFTIPTEERMRALVSGPPAYMRRRREIEDLEAAIRGAVRAVEEGRARDSDLSRLRIERQLVRLNTLIDQHNRYYPGEANLPMDPTTGALLENGEPWSPLPHVTLASLGRAPR